MNLLSSSTTKLIDFKFHKEKRTEETMVILPLLSSKSILIDISFFFLKMLMLLFPTVFMSMVI